MKRIFYNFLKFLDFTDAKETLIKIQEQQETLESEAETLTESITEGHKV